MCDLLLLLFPDPPSTHTPLTSWHGLGHAQAGRFERDPLRFTRDRRLAAEHGLDLRGRRDELVGLAHRQPLARLRLRLADEVAEITAGGGRLPSIDRLEGRVELDVQAILQAAGEAHTVDRRHQVTDLGGGAVDHHLEAARRGIGRTRRVAGRTVDRRGANRERAARSRRTTHGRRGGRIIGFAGGRRIGDGCALRAGGIHGEWAARQAEHRHAELEGPDVAGGSLRAADATLVGCDGAGTHRNLVDGWAAIEKGQRLRGAAIIRQAGGQHGIGVLLRGAGREAATAITRRVVTLVDQEARDAHVATRVGGHDAPADVVYYRQVDFDAAALAGGSGVTGDCAVADAQRLLVVDAAAAAGSGVAGDRAVADAQRAASDDDVDS